MDREFSHADNCGDRRWWSITTKACIGKLDYNKSMNRLDEISKQIDQHKQPPVHLWNPDHIGEIDIKIDVQGNWFHEGGQISRDELVRLFASILWHENDQHYLVTPVERLRISVEDVPYVVNTVEKVAGIWVAKTNTEEQVLVGEDHPVELREFSGQLVPYIRIRYELWARLNRSSYIHWVNESLSDSEEHEGENPELVLTSGDYSFEVARLS